MQKRIVLPVMALAFGGAGFALRRWELNTAFEPGSGLHIPGAPATWLLLALSMLVTGLFVLLCAGQHDSFPGGYGAAFGTESTLLLTVQVTAGFLLGAAALLHIPALAAAVSVRRRADFRISLPRAVLSSSPMLLLCVLAAAAAVCIVVTAKNNYRAQEGARRSGMLLVPAYACALWLVTAYQKRAGDPVVMAYLYELVAVMAALLCLYFMAGFSFEKAKVGRTAFFGLMAVYFSMVTLADAHGPEVRLLYGFVICYLSASVSALLANDGRMQRAAPACGGGPEQVGPAEGETPSRTGAGEAMIAEDFSIEDILLEVKNPAKEENHETE